MPIIHLITLINAPIQLVFDAARSIDLHQESMAHTQERAVAGKIQGLIELGETVTWEASHFGVLQRLTVKITEMESPASFTDEMVSGAFKRFKHVHRFLEQEGMTIMEDEFDYRAPLGLLGRVADVLFLKKYMTKLLRKRNKIITHHLERGKN
jgi:ligand-binding SRPBCC domain-containing protein